MSDPTEEGRSTVSAETGCGDDERFLLELEFVQCLSNPHYLNCTAASSTGLDTSHLAIEHGPIYRAGTASVFQGQGLHTLSFLPPILAAPRVQSALSVRVRDCSDLGHGICCASERHRTQVPTLPLLLGAATERGVSLQLGAQRCCSDVPALRYAAS